MKPEDYTIEYCPYCDTDVAIHAHGVTACPESGKPLAPCTVCHDERGGCSATEPCPYGCAYGGECLKDETIQITNPPMTPEEIAFAWANC